MTSFHPLPVQARASESFEKSMIGVVTSTVLSRLSYLSELGRSAVESRLRREGTDPAWRGRAERRPPWGGRR
jgi:hypothetical protein